MTLQTHVLLSPGTHVVTRIPTKAQGKHYGPGTVGVVEEAPIDATHAYAIRFPDGGLGHLTRTEMTIRKHERIEGIANAAALQERNLKQYVILRVLVGSHAYRLAGPDSDRDVRGVYLPPADYHWSLYGVPLQLENREADEVYWELGRVIDLMLKANPNVLEVLWSPVVLDVSEWGQRLRDERAIFLSKHVYQTYTGYVMGQFKKIEQDIRANNEIRMKHAMHLVRLLISGIHILRSSEVLVDVGPYRDRLLSIRAGEVEWEDINTWRLSLHEEFERAFAETRLPARPDYVAANAFLIEARRSMVDVAA